MKGVKQKIVNSKKGDCFRACMASLLELDNNDKLPNSHEGDWMHPWIKFLNNIGLELGFDKSKIWRAGYWIAVVPSLNFEDTTHVIVMKGIKVAFDPSTKKKYPIGKNLLASDKVSFGYWIELSDIGKFKKYLNE